MGYVRTYNPILQPINVDEYLAIELRAPRRNTLPIIFEPVDSLFAEVPNKVDSFLEAKSLLVHYYRHEVEGIVTRLLDVVRE